MALDKKEKKKVSSDGLSTKEKMLARKKQLESKGNGNGLVFPKEGTLRMRIKSPGDDQELGIEIVQFYLGGNLGGVISVSYTHVKGVRPAVPAETPRSHRTDGLTWSRTSCGTNSAAAKSALNDKFYTMHQPEADAAVSYTHLDVYKRQVQTDKTPEVPQALPVKKEKRNEVIRWRCV